MRITNAADEGERGAASLLAITLTHTASMKRQSFVSTRCLVSLVPALESKTSRQNLYQSQEDKYLE